MTDAMSDVNEYWNRRCDDCQKQNPKLYQTCNRSASFSILKRCKFKGE